jgi:hypothetical protein
MKTLLTNIAAALCLAAILVLAGIGLVVTGAV